MPDTVMNGSEAALFRNRSASIAALAAALAAAQKSFDSIPKDREVKVTTRTGGTYTFRYATMDAILSATMPALAEQGLAISQGLSSWGDQYAVETTLYHSSGEWISNITPMYVSGRQGNDGKVYPPGNQELGSAQTYARRYGVSALLCITADEDDDGNHADGNHAERVPFKPGARGSAGAGTQFRPERRRHPGNAQTESLRVDPADRDMVQGDGRSQYDADKAKRETATQAGFGRPEDAKAAKIKAATDKRVAALKEGAPWTRADLDKFWNDDGTWRDWMADDNNGASKEYQRYLDAFNAAELDVRSEA